MKLGVKPEPNSPDAKAAARSTDETLQAGMVRRIKPIGVVLLVYYGILAIAHLIVLPPPASVIMASWAAGSALFGLALASNLVRQKIGPRFAHEAAFVAGLVVVSNGLLMLILQPNPLQTTNLVLSQIGIGAVLLSRRWSWFTHALILAGWLAVVQAKPHPDWGHFGFALLAGLVLSQMVQEIQIRTLKRIDAERRKTAQQRELAQAGEERWRRMLDASFEGVAVVASGKIQQSNPAFKHLVEDVAADPVIDSLHSVVAHASWPKLDELLSGPTEEPIELLLRPVAGESRSVAMASRQMVMDGNTVSVVTMHDVTELRRWEAGIEESKLATEEAAEAKGQFLANMSHELRTPLNGIIGMSELLHSTDLTPEQLDHLDTILASGKHLLAVISNLLDYSRLEAEKIELENREFSIWEFVESTMSMIDPRAATERLEIAHRIDEDVPEAVFGDEFRLRQVLLNLLSNSVKFTEKGLVSLRVSIADANIRFEVADTGPGIPENRLASLFSPFVQADRSTTRRFGGTGLGLVISSELVALMGGKIDVESKIDEGSKFYFSIPLKVAKPARDDANQSMGEVAVCLEEDLVSAHVATILKQAGYSPIEAELVTGKVDVVIAEVDVLQEGDSPSTALQKILKESPDARRVLLVRAGESEEGTSFGNSNRCRTPVRRSELLKAVAGVSDGSTRATSNEEAPESAFSKLRILVADDDSTNRKVMRQFLKKIGAGAEFAEDGQQAIELASTQAFDVLFIDYQMPNKDGLEVLQVLRSTENPCKSSYMALLTADARPERVDAAIAAGANQHLAKPIALETIRKVLQGVIAGDVEAAQPQAEASATGQLVDASVVEEMRETLGDEVFAEILTTFLSELEQLVATAESGLTGGNLPEARRAFHTIGSNAAAFGAMELSGMGRTAEYACEAEDGRKAGDLLEPIKQQVAAVGVFFATSQSSPED